MRRRQEETNPASPTFPLKSTLIVVFVLRLDCPYHQQIGIRGRAELPSNLITHHSLSQNIFNCCSSLTQRNHMISFQQFHTTFTFILVLISYATMKLGPGEELSIFALHLLQEYLFVVWKVKLCIVYICHTCTTSLVAKLPTLAVYIEMCGHVYWLKNPCLWPQKFISYCYLWLTGSFR